MGPGNAAAGRLIQEPAPEIDQLRTSCAFEAASLQVTPQQPAQVPGLSGDRFDITFALAPSSSGVRLFCTLMSVPNKIHHMYELSSNESSLQRLDRHAAAGPPSDPRLGGACHFCTIVLLADLVSLPC